MFLKILIVSFALCSLLVLPQSINADPLQIKPITVNEIVIKYSKEYGLSAKTMLAVIKCESHAYPKAINENLNKQGKVWSRDYGPFQLNDYYHKIPAQKMGLSIYDIENNIHYGAYLMKTQGLKPWSASKKCWSKLI